MSSIECSSLKAAKSMFIKIAMHVGSSSALVVLRLCRSRMRASSLVYGRSRKLSPTLEPAIRVVLEVSRG